MAKVSSPTGADEKKGEKIKRVLALLSFAVNDVNDPLLTLLLGWKAGRSAFQVGAMHCRTPTIFL